MRGWGVTPLRGGSCKGEFQGLDFFFPARLRKLTDHWPNHAYHYSKPQKLSSGQFWGDYGNRSLGLLMEWGPWVLGEPRQG